jgi:OOP family OmpA-OmpF porin
LPITERWSLLGRVGAAYAQTQDTFSGTGAVTVLDPSPRKRETNYKYGVGTQYAFTPALTLRLEAERYRVNDAVGNRGDVDMVSVGLVYRFGGSQPSVKTVYTPYVAPTPAPVMAQAPAPQPPAAQPVIVVVPAPVAAPVAAPAPKPWVKVKLQADSLFGFDQDRLQADGQQALDKLMVELKDVNVEAIQVIGHTDRLGTPAYNDKLSMRRAEAVQNYLVQVGGVPASKISAKGVGSRQPDTSPDECKGLKAGQALITCLRVDRRVEIEVTGDKQAR